MSEIISISTLAYDGHDLETALEHISRVGSEYVEICAVERVSDHIKQSDFEDNMFGRKIDTMMKDSHLFSIAFSMGIDLSKEKIIPVFEKRMKFCKNLGIKIVNTFSGPLDRVNTFQENIEFIDKLAKAMDLIVTLELETQEDIISDINIVDKIHSENIKINYDFVNAFHAAKGEINLEEDFRSRLDYITHLHLKDTILKEGIWHFTQIGKGIMDYESIFKVLKESNKKIPMCIELPLRLEMKEDKVRISQKTKPRLEIEQINKIVSESLSYVRELWKSA